MQFCGDRVWTIVIQACSCKHLCDPGSYCCACGLFVFPVRGGIVKVCRSAGKAPVSYREKDIFAIHGTDWKPKLVPPHTSPPPSLHLPPPQHTHCIPIQKVHASKRRVLVSLLQMAVSERSRLGEMAMCFVLDKPVKCHCSAGRIAKVNTAAAWDDRLQRMFRLHTQQLHRMRRGRTPLLWWNGSLPNMALATQPGRCTLSHNISSGKSCGAFEQQHACCNDVTIHF